MNLRRAAFSAGRWTAASLTIRALLQIGQTMILARLLMPADFGVIAIVGAAYAIATLFVDLGLSNALVHFPDPSPEILSTLYWLNLGAAVLTMLAFMALSWPMALVYGQPELPTLMVVLGATMPLAALGQQFCVLAEKRLRFSVLAKIEVIAAGCGFATAIATALLGGGVYALVVAAPVTAAATSALAWTSLSKGVRPEFDFRWDGIKPYLRYGSYRMGETLINSVQSQADLLIGGAVAGAAAMGAYSLPRNLALQIAHTVVNPVVMRVGLPVMARLQGDRAALNRAYLQTLRLTTSVNFPVYAALAVWAQEAVVILLGERWHQAHEFMRLFALWAMIRSTASPVGSLLYATGRVRAAFWWNAALLSIVPGILWLAVAMGGTRALAAAMALVQLMVAYPLFRFLVQPACGARFDEYLGAMLPALAASAFAVSVGYAVSSLFGQQSSAVHMLVGCATAAATYLLASFVVNRAWVMAMLELLGPMLPRRKPSISGEDP